MTTPASSTSETRTIAAEAAVAFSAIELVLFFAAAAAGTALSRRRATATGLDELPPPSSRGESSSTAAAATKAEVDDALSDESNSVTNASGMDRNVALPPPTHLRPLRSLGTVTVAYVSTTGTCLDLAQMMAGALRSRLPFASVQVCRADEMDWWDEILNPPSAATSLTTSGGDDNDTDTGTGSGSGSESARVGSSVDPIPPAAILILPTWTGGALPAIGGGGAAEKGARGPDLLSALEDVANDWRVEPFPLRPSPFPSSSPLNPGLYVAVFGVGSSAYDPDTFCRPAKQAYDCLVGRLGARPIGGGGGGGASRRRRHQRRVGETERGGIGIGTGDVEAQDVSAVFEGWAKGVAGWLAAEASAKHKAKTKARTLTGAADSRGGSGGCCCETENKNEEGKGSAGGMAGCCQQQGDGDENRDGVARASCACKDGLEDVEEKEEHGGIHKEKGKEEHRFAAQNDEDDDDEEEDDDDDYDDDDEDEYREPDVIDLEDMGDAMKASTSISASPDGPKKEMVTPRQASQLQKEGYKLIGTHSAVKLCRWTKHQLRGRGGCYKHTFYGITSYRCMEATPSLACANKCVFCWRHHKNPVGREWRWKTDDPIDIVNGAIDAHVRMIKEARGIPGVRLDRWKEAHTVRHCALSLVGEPIMYPRIDEFLAELHSRHISTFLVTNGQHPDAIEQIRPVTQLYVSVDAPTEHALVEIDRPLFSDAWDRLRSSLSSLRDKNQRTVARLTIVKGWNADEIGGYAELIALGKVSLVEVKGVTFCGKSDASDLTMSNTPWHHEVVALTERLRDELARIRKDQLEGKRGIVGVDVDDDGTSAAAASAAGKGGRRGVKSTAEDGTSEKKIAEEDIVPEYGLACEHKHSCSVLLARVDQFASSAPDPITGRRSWNTWIDYDEFDRLAARHAADPTFTFGVEDYTAPTPNWALFGSDEEGFDPTDTRHRKKGKRPLYTKFDEEGVPTHDSEGGVLAVEERTRLRGLMQERRREMDAAEVAAAATKTKASKKVGSGAGGGGFKEVEDPSLMFRGLVVGQA